MRDEHIKFAIDLAKEAEKKGEVPIACVIVDNKNNLISYASNSSMNDYDPTSHAEILAIKRACQKLKTIKLIDFSIYVTLEPCRMCEAAIISVGIKKIYFGAYSANLKIYKSKLRNYFSLNKKYEYFGGIEESCCSKLIKDFFNKKR